MANTMQISKDDLEDLKEAFAKVGKSQHGEHLAPVCCEMGLSHPCACYMGSLLLSWSSACRGVSWQPCCFWLVTPSQGAQREVAAGLSMSTGTEPCPVAAGWALLVPDGRRYIQAGIAVLQPRQQPGLAQSLALRMMVLAGRPIHAHVNV